MAGFFLPMRPYQIIYYRGFGSPKAVWLTGRVLRQHELATPADGASFWHNLSATVRRFLTDEVGNLQVRIETFGQTFETTTNDEGYFDITVDPHIELPAGRAWFPVRYTLVGVRQPGSGAEVVCDGQLMIAPAYSQFGIISDIDDTVLVTGATSLWQTLRLTFLENAFTRLPFAGVAAFYRALQSGAVTTLFNPIYFVSSSPWNLYDLLIDFFRIQGLPKGPLLLRDLSLNADLLSSTGHHTHKRAMIDKVLAVNPDLPFVLLGDSGQQDPEIYADVIRANPGRIRAVYIRDVSTDDRRDSAVQKLIAAAGTPDRADHYVPMLLVADTVAAAEHAAALGLIDPDSLPEIRADRRADMEGK
jgi:phosphatidate phosphatase APP1